MPDVLFATEPQRGLHLVQVARRGPLLRPSATLPGVYGLDLTAGCGHGCAYCPSRSAGKDASLDRVLFDPATADRLGPALDALGASVRRVVLSPLSDPLPPDRAVRAVATRCAAIVLEQGRALTLQTRGRIPGALHAILARHPERATVAIGLTSLDKLVSRALEPRAAAPAIRLRDLKRLADAGVDVEARLEPLIVGLTDTRESLRPLLHAVAEAGVRRVVAHYLYRHSGTSTRLAEALAPLGLAERIDDDFAGGPAFALGSIGLTKHYPVEARREGLARLIAWGAEFGLTVTTGSAQNPDLPRPEAPPIRPIARETRPGRPTAVADPGAPHADVADPAASAGPLAAAS